MTFLSICGIKITMSKSIQKITALDLAKYLVRLNEKAFEKLETISVGRALSLLGYLNNGEIASSEEMEEFEDFKKRKVEDQSKELINKLKSSKNLKELQDNFVKGINQFKGNNEVIAELIQIKDNLKGKLK